MLEGGQALSFLRYGVRECGKDGETFVQYPVRRCQESNGLDCRFLFEISTQRTMKSNRYISHPIFAGYSVHNSAQPSIDGTQAKLCSSAISSTMLTARARKRYRLRQIDRDGTAKFLGIGYVSEGFAQALLVVCCYRV